ncbi:MAG: serine hydrolase, partial [Allomuricauda sp.]
MKRTFTLLTTLLLVLSFTSHGQEIYFPDRNATWKGATENQFKIDQAKLKTVVEFAENNEYSGSRDLKQAILKGFEREPFHDILGPTKERGGPAGMILKDGYLLASWGDTKRVDMTFSVTK